MKFVLQLINYLIAAVACVIASLTFAGFCVQVLSMETYSPADFYMSLKLVLVTMFFGLNGKYLD